MKLIKNTESQILSYVLNSGDVTFFDKNGIDKSWFKHRKTEYEAVKEHIDKYGKTPNINTFADRFPDSKIVSTTESPDVLMDMFYNYKMYNQAIPDYNELGKLLEAGDIETATSMLVAMGPRYTRPVTTMSTTSYKNDADKRLAEYTKRCDPNHRQYIRTGHPELDKAIGGYTTNEGPCIIAARTNVGKSWELAFGACTSAMDGLKVGYWSGEMAAEAIGFRFDTYIGKLPNGKMVHGDISIKASYERHIKDIQKNLKGDIITLTPKDLGGRFATVHDLSAFIEINKLDALYIDQISLMKESKNAKSIREQFVNLADDLMELNTKYQIPIIAASQLNREDTSQKGGADATNLSESDKIGQNAALLIILSKNNKDENSPLTMQVAKNRYGPVGAKLNYMWDINQGKYIFINEGQSWLNEGETSDPSLSPVEVSTEVF